MGKVIEGDYGPEQDLEHDLGECERWWGYLCEDCRITFQEQIDDWAYQDMLDTGGHNGKQELPSWA